MLTEAVGDALVPLAGLRDPAWVPGGHGEAGLGGNHFRPGASAPSPLAWATTSSVPRYWAAAAAIASSIPLGRQRELRERRAPLVEAPLHRILGASPRGRAGESTNPSVPLLELA